MSEIISLENAFDAEIKNGLEKIDDVLAHFMEIEETSLTAKTITSLLYAALKIGEMHVEQ